jgi:hypothetical protein
MSIADHFEHRPDASFVRRYDSSSARRQFQLSLVLMIVLAIAAFALGTMIRFDDAVAADSNGTPAAVTKPIPKKHSVNVGTDFA